jgi:hypothetical protein
MPIERKFTEIVERPAVVKKTVTYKCECDVLFIPVEKEDIVLQDDRWIVSRQARDRLPPFFQRNKNKEFLRLLMRGCGTKDQGFKPEMIHEGWWVIKVMGPNRVVLLCCDTYSTGQDYKLQISHRTRFSSLSDVANWVEKDDLRHTTYHIFYNGEFQRTLRWGVITET